MKRFREVNSQEHKSATEFQCHHLWKHGNLREVSNCASLFSDRLTISEFTILRKLADQKSKAHTHMV